MSLRRHHQTSPAGMDLTTMSDITFCLLLFFILTQSFLSSITLDLPRLQAGETVLDQKAKAIELTASDTIVLQGREHSAPSWKEAISQAFAGTPASATIVIRAHKRSSTGAAVEILDHLRGLGIRQITFLALPVAPEAGGR